MAVYTHVAFDEIANFLDRYDVGDLRSANGFAAGVENSNYLLETSKERFVLTLYEKRVDENDLPFFMDLLEHLSDRGCRVPRFIADRNGKRLQQLAGRRTCLIEFLNGTSVTEPSDRLARSVGRTLGELHTAAADFSDHLTNKMGMAAWRDLAATCAGHLDAIAPGLEQRVALELAFLDRHWPATLPTAVIHADLFPDNVLVQGDLVTGLIDFYFSCTEVRAFDLAITHAAWCFDSSGKEYFPERAKALVGGYEETFGLSSEERDGFTALCRAAALRFLLTRAYDWINTAPDALVNRKDPADFLRRLDYYAGATPNDLLGA